MSYLHSISAINNFGVQPNVAITQNSMPENFDFASMLGSEIKVIDNKVSKAEGLLTRISSGETVSTHELMIAFENARHTLQVAVEVRNRLLESYTEIVRMQV